MTITYTEWRIREIKTMTENTAEQCKILDKIGIPTHSLHLLLLVFIEYMYSKEMLVWFLNNQDKIE